VSIGLYLQWMGASTSTPKLRIACVGDSITQGFRGIWSAPSEHAYPSQLQALLGTGFDVVNIGNPGSTLSKAGMDGAGEYKSTAAYWDRPQFVELTSARWDVVVVMLGTNDAKLQSSGAGVDNWQGAEHFLTSFAELLAVVLSLNGDDAAPHVLCCTSAPSMKEGAYGTSRELINTVLPGLVAQAVQVAREDHPTADIALVDVFSALGGQQASLVPEAGLSLEFTQAHPDPSLPCIHFCDDGWNDQVHPCDRGFTSIAEAVHKAISESLGRRQI